MKKPHLVIVGGGFGGLAAARKLSNTNIKVTLIDKKNYHLFQPLLYQVATAGLSPAEIAYPLRQLLAGCQNIEILLGEVQEIDKEKKIVRTEANQVSFDYLLLACGSTYTYFGNNQWEPFAPGLKTIAQATEIRRRVFLAFEKAERETDPEKKRALQTFLVIGGGPTGVELAGAIGEIAKYTITRDFKHINPEFTRIVLVEMGKRILPSMTEPLSEEAVRELGQLGVEVRTSTKVGEINEFGAKLNDDFVSAGTVLWAAGVGANPLNKMLGEELDRQGRIVVNPDCSIKSARDIFVIGDQANLNNLPGLAPVAMQQGRFVAKNILRESHGVPRKEYFHYVDKGQMATVGRSRAVALFRGIEFHGILAWLGWLTIHIYYLIGFKNRVFVLFQWAWTYLTFRRGARLIIDKN